MSHFAKCLGDYYCPVCGILGQLKLRFKRSGNYFYIDHYKGKKGLKKRLPLRRGSKWAYTCYLGPIIVESSSACYYLDYPQPTLFAVALGRHFL